MHAQRWQRQDLPRMSSGIPERTSALTLTSAHQHGSSGDSVFASAQSFGCPQTGQHESRFTAESGKALTWELLAANSRLLPRWHRLRLWLLAFGFFFLVFTSHDDLSLSLLLKPAGYCCPTAEVYSAKFIAAKQALTSINFHFSIAVTRHRQLTTPTEQSHLNSEGW